MLAELTLPTLTPTLIHNVASLPALERLEIVTYDLWPLPVEHHTATLDDFPSLKSLTMMFNQSLVLDFLSQFRFPELTKLCLYPDLETPQEYERFLRILAAKLPQQKAFGIETSYQGHWGGGFLSYDVLRYILPCKNLQILDLEKVVTCLRGEELTSLTQALPFLVSLKLNNDVSHQDLFLSALESMIPHCLKLKHLHLNFTRSTEVLEASTGKRFSRLESLRTRTIPASDPAMIAPYLHEILPQQCCISGLSDSLDKDCCLFWDNVVEECKYLICKSNDDA
ncbi:hypothetical protein ONZ45_g9343 [Pleurotus djamor]|nr:hypothetical protein ONZ45_g9343 [Pleurotus djamor]